MKYTCLLLMSAALFLGACQEATSEPGGADTQEIEGGELVNEFGKPTFDATGDEEFVPSKSDALVGRGGLPVSIDNAATQVWQVKNSWEDRDTPNARKAGMSWGANSGLTWEEKFTQWVDSLEKRPSETRPGVETYTLTTPWGKSMPAPSLECAESAIFLRVAFAAWHNLPFYLEAATAKGRIYFGHFGMRQGDERYPRTPNFKTRYEDFTARAEQVRSGGQWPVDSDLVRKKIPGTSDDTQLMIGPDAHAGAYFDQVFLNKRVGHFLVTTLAFFGSIHLADSRNMFNVKPVGLTTGDVLVHRWQRQGIGHVLLVMDVDQVGEVNGEPRYEAELASGSMPRRQPVWEASNTSMRSFMTEDAGGPGKESLGGGLKRWRIAKKINGRWANVVSELSSSDWVNSKSTDKIGERPELFGRILKQLSSDEKRDTLLEVIENERSHLRRFPASCAARIRREKAFGELYDLMESDFNKSATQVDQEFRTMEDYVFAELSYEESKTCCWNSSNANMHEIIMDLNREQQDAAQACMPLVVFKNRDDAGDGFELFREHAVKLGRGDQWVPWSADESCPQSSVAADTEVNSGVTPFCSLTTQPSAGATTTQAFTGSTFEIPDNSTQGITFTVEVTQDGDIQSLALDLSIEHTYRGDLWVELTAPNGNTVVLKERSVDSGDDLQERYTPENFRGQDALGTWTLTIKDLASQDLGVVQDAALTIAR